MEGDDLNNREWKGKANVTSTSEDVQERMYFPNEGTSIFEEGNVSENKDLEKEVIVGGLFYDAQENITQDQPSLVYLPDPGHMARPAEVEIFSPPIRVEEGDVLVSQSDHGSGDERSRTRTYPCRYCTKQFSSAQALGGHQNSHKHEREFAKRQRVNAHGYMPYTYRLPNSLAFGTPQLRPYNANNLTLARPPLGYPYFMPGFPNTQYPRSTIGLNLGHFGLSSGMLFKTTQIPVYDRHRTTNPYTGNNGNDNHTSGNFNSMGITSAEEGGTSSDLFRTLFGLSQGENNVRDELKDTIEACGESDGTTDLLSRVGMDSGIDRENNGGGSNGETGVADGTLDLLSRVGVIDHANEEHNGDGSSSPLD